MLLENSIIKKRNELLLPTIKEVIEKGKYKVEKGLTLTIEYIKQKENGFECSHYIVIPLNIETYKYTVTYCNNYLSSDIEFEISEEEYHTFMQIAGILF